MPRRILVAVAAVLALGLVGCGSSGSGGGHAASAPPTVNGEFGSKPTITFPPGQPGKALQKIVLHDGTGPAVATGDLLVGNYLGQVWNGKVFDNSYDRHVPIGVAIGSGQVIKGWDEGLVGVHAGSRVLLVIPPDKGYGSAGNTQAGIKGTDTLVFVIDVIARYGGKAAGDPHAKAQREPAGAPKVTGALGAQPTVTVPKNSKPPSSRKVIVIAKASGKPTRAGLVVVQYVAVDWSGHAAGSTWTAGSGAPAGVPIGQPGQPNPFDALVGVPVGSRVLIEDPAVKGAQPSPPHAIVVDIVAEPA